MMENIEKVQKHWQGREREKKKWNTFIHTAMANATRDYTLRAAF